jgi:argininosuccinate lyase
VFDALTIEATLSAKSAKGGTSPERVKEALEEAKRSLA